MYGYKEEKWATFSTREKVVRAIEDQYERHILCDNIATINGCKVNEYPFKIITSVGAQYNIKDECLSKFIDRGDLIFTKESYWIITNIEWFDDHLPKTVTAITCEHSWLGQHLSKQKFNDFREARFHKTI